MFLPCCELYCRKGGAKPRQWQFVDGTTCLSARRSLRVEVIGGNLVQTTRPNPATSEIVALRPKDFVIIQLHRILQKFGESFLSASRIFRPWQNCWIKRTHEAANGISQMKLRRHGLPSSCSVTY
jgi:hypothetical protein